MENEKHPLLKETVCLKNTPFPRFFQTWVVASHVASDPPPLPLAGGGGCIGQMPTSEWPSRHKPKGLNSVTYRHLRTRRALLLYKVYGNNALLAHNWQYYNFSYIPEWQLGLNQGGEGNETIAKCRGGGGGWVESFCIILGFKLCQVSRVTVQMSMGMSHGILLESLVCDSSHDSITTRGGGGGASPHNWSPTVSKIKTSKGCVFFRHLHCRHFHDFFLHFPSHEG